MRNLFFFFKNFPSLFPISSLLIIIYSLATIFSFSVGNNIGEGGLLIYIFLLLIFRVGWPIIGIAFIIELNIKRENDAQSTVLFSCLFRGLFITGIVLTYLVVSCST